jgi:hypothetical protein
MDQPATPQPRARLLIVLPGCLLVSIILIAVLKFFVARSIASFVRHLTGQAPVDPHVKASVAKAKKKVRRAANGFNFAKRHYERAAAKLAKAQAALDAAQGQPARAAEKAVEITEANAVTPEQWWTSPKGRFVIGSGKMLAAYLLKQRQKRK